MAYETDRRLYLVECDLPFEATDPQAVRNSVPSQTGSRPGLGEDKP